MHERFSKRKHEAGILFGLNKFRVIFSNMPRRFNWTQKDAQNLVDEYLSGKIPSARNLYNRMRASGIHISKNTVYSRVRGELKAVSCIGYI